jgi:electron transfer flavoprotein alpha/beta subunit
MSVTTLEVEGRIEAVSKHGKLFVEGQGERLQVGVSSLAALWRLRYLLRSLLRQRAFAIQGLSETKVHISVLLADQQVVDLDPQQTPEGVARWLGLPYGSIQWSGLVQALRKSF